MAMKNDITKVWVSKSLVNVAVLRMAVGWSRWRRRRVCGVWLRENA